MDMKCWVYCSENERIKIQISGMCIKPHNAAQALIFFCQMSFRAYLKAKTLNEIWLKCCEKWCIFHYKYNCICIFMLFEHPNLKKNLSMFSSGRISVLTHRTQALGWIFLFPLAVTAGKFSCIPPQNVTSYIKSNATENRLQWQDLTLKH